MVCVQGHVDFSYEVSRSLAASQGVLLLVDAQQVSQSGDPGICIAVAGCMRIYTQCG